MMLLRRHSFAPVLFLVAIFASPASASILPNGFEAEGPGTPGEGTEPAKFVAFREGVSWRIGPEGVEIAPHGAAAGPRMTLRLLNANPAAPPIPRDPLPGLVNRYAGSDPSRWATGIRRFARVEYPDVLPGVTLAWYGSGGVIEFDAILEPGADLRALRFEIGGATRASLDPNGDVVVPDDPATADGTGSVRTELRIRRPRVFEVVGGDRRAEASGRCLRRTGVEVVHRVRELSAIFGGLDDGRGRRALNGPVDDPVEGE